jgi:hypothetical protein
MVLLPAACKSGDSPTATVVTPSPTPASSSVAMASPTLLTKIDPCGLLTSDEIKAVQGEGVNSSSRSDRTSADFVLSQCYYQLPTMSNSVVVNVTTAKAGGKESPLEFWRRTFVEPKGEREKGEGEAEEEEGAKPEKVAGVGEDAYWEASGISGALYVLKNDVIFRISVGGAGDIKSKLNKSKTLAQKALARIS